MSVRRYVDTDCRTCRQPVLVGPDNDKCARTATCDHTALTRTGELLAVISGRTTYEDDGHSLHRRDRWRITKPAPRVVAEHRCHQPTPAHWTQPPQPKPTTPERPF
jgi:hypothetical protein